MSTIRWKDIPWWQQPSNVGIAWMLVVCVCVLVGVLGSGAIWSSGKQSTYLSAPVCASAADVSNCRFQGPARVVSTWQKSGLWVEVAFDQLGGRRFDADVDPSARSTWQTWKPEDQVAAELWQGQVTVVGGLRTSRNPDSMTGLFFPAVWIVIAVMIPLLALMAWWTVAYRRAARVLANREATMVAEHPITTQRLPLTPDMVNALQSEMAPARHPTRLALIILAVALSVPATTGVIFYLQGRFAAPSILLLAAAFLVVGGFATVWVLGTATMEKRDLAGGAFVRATGVFQVGVYTSKGITTTQVTIGGRIASGGRPQALETIVDAVGTVDYLPVSGELFEVRDESGQVLWSRTSPVTAHVVPAGAAT